MRNDLVYMLGVVAVGFIVNFGLRALPFLLFAGKGRGLPRGVERFGSFVSPVIICGLIFYSYSGLEWTTTSPYVAGALVVGLQLWKRNPLASIVAGTVLYMCLLTCGCTTQRMIELDAENSDIRISSLGVLVGDEYVEPKEVAEILEDCDIPHDRAIYILLDPDVKNLRPARYLMACLSQAGYTSSVLVTRRHAESMNLGKKKFSAPVRKQEARRVIRYKKATE